MVSQSLFDAFAISAPGLAPMVAAELSALGVTVGEVESAGVSFSADSTTLLRVNLWSRLASRIVVRLATFTARDFATLEKRARTVPWSRVLTNGTPARLRVTCRKSKLYHSDAVAQRVAGAISASVRGAKVVDLRAGAENDHDSDADTETFTGLISESQAIAGGDDTTVASPQLFIVRFDRDVCTISADASGALLHRRGWRQVTAKAPLRETLAAALLTVSRWPGDVPLVDPLAGSGTIAIEAALRARNIAPGLARRFACEFWPGMDASTMRALRDEARRGQRAAAGVPIIAADRDAGAITAIRANAERAGVLDDLTVLQQPMTALRLTDIGKHGWLVTNPPYGLRIGDATSLRALWGTLGAAVRAGGAGWTLAAVVPDPTLGRELRLPLEPGVATTTGGLPIQLVRSRPKPDPSGTDRYSSAPAPSPAPTSSAT